MTQLAAVGDGARARAVHMTRGRLFRMIAAVETDIRRILREHVLIVTSEEAALGADFGTALARRDADASGEPADVLEYLDLQPEILALARALELLPGSLHSDVKYLVTMISAIAPIRNRVMHGRPLRPNDFELTLEVVRRLSHREWELTKETLAILESDDSWDPAYSPATRSQDRVLNNLPDADYDDTGLIGRAEETSQLLGLLRKRRSQCITITGEGGIGKTALALEVAYALLDDEESRFDLIVWTTLKTERLTPSGVRAIEGAVRDLGGILEETATALGEHVTANAGELSSLLDGIDTLLVVDNLETVHGDEVVEFLDSLPESVTVLATSRVGLGQLERRVPIGPLSLEGASRLYRKHAAQQGLQKYAAASQDTVGKVVEALRFSPLAIRWYILSVAAGAEPLQTLRNQSELIQFCVQNVFDGLGEEAKTMLAVLAALPDALTFDEAAVFCDLPVDSLRRAAQELSRSALIAYEPRESAPEVTQMRLSETARKYLPSQGSTTSGQRVADTRLDYLRSDERRRRDETARPLAPQNVRVQAEDERPSAYLLREALSVSKRREFDTAHQLVNRAIELAPGYWEAHRVSALIHKFEGNTQKAEGAFREAIACAQSPRNRAIVNHDYAQFVAKVMSNPAAAVELERAAHSVLDLPDTQLALGNYLSWLNEFEESVELLTDLAGIQRSERRSVDARFRAICFTALVDAYRRWAETAWERSEAETALGKAVTAMEFGVLVTNGDMLDMRLAERTLRAACDAFFYSSMSTLDAGEFDARSLNAIGSMRGYPEIFMASEAWPRFREAVRRWSELRVLGDVETQTVEWVLSAKRAPGGPVVGADTVGTLKAWKDNFGFVALDGHPDVFVHFTAFEDGAHIDAASVGRLVAFNLRADGTGRFRAERARLL